MKERPSLFSGPMVRVMLDGRKTQTRRVIKPQPPAINDVRAKSGSDYCWLPPEGSIDYWRPAGPVWAVRELMGREPQLRCPWGSCGDRLWVRESIEILSFGASCAHVRYLADGCTWVVHDSRLPNRLGGLSSIHMPRNVSRITLEITSVGVEQLQDITEEDAIAEGFMKLPATGRAVLSRGGQYFGNCWGSPIQGFAELWDMINAKRGFSWAVNPWVWVVQFERVDE